MSILELQELFLQILAWLNLFFWPLDLCLNLSTGFHRRRGYVHFFRDLESRSRVTRASEARHADHEEVQYCQALLPALARLRPERRDHRLGPSLSP